MGAVTVVAVAAAWLRCDPVKVAEPVNELGPVGGIETKRLQGCKGTAVVVGNQRSKLLRHVTRRLLPAPTCWAPCGDGSCSCCLRLLHAWSLC